MFSDYAEALRVARKLSVCLAAAASLYSRAICRRSSRPMHCEWCAEKRSGRPRLQVVSRRESVGLDLGEGAQRPHESGCEASEGLDDEKDNEVAAGEGFVVVRELLRAGGAHVRG